MNETFARDVLKGLKASPKSLSSKYFYDARGDKLFQDIMELPEYYLTRTEFSILKQYREELYRQFSNNNSDNFDLIELGAGDGTKTKLLLEEFLGGNVRFTYYPVDISKNVLEELSANLKRDYPSLIFKAMPMEYFEAIKAIDNGNGKRKKIILFLGSNIGNFDEDTSDSFLQGLSNALDVGDMVLIGFDCKKDPNVILKAYSDSAGVTREFNLNLLDRINRELGADFNRDNFMHSAVYNPEDGRASSYLVSRVDQKVSLLNETITFKAWETIHVEISQKFDEQMIAQLAANSGFDIVEKYFDEKMYFVDALWRKK